VPHSDFFNFENLNPEWSFLGYTSANTYSLTSRSGWLALTQKGRSRANTIIKNDGEHNYSLITKVDFTPQTVNDGAGLQILNGLQTLYVKLFSSIDSLGNKIIAFSYDTTYYYSKNTNTDNDIIMLKIVRVNHVITGYYSIDGFNWVQVGSSINVANMENEQANYNSWTGNRQGLFVVGGTAYFDYYIYRDAYTPILAECPANQYGTSITAKKNGISSLDNIHNDDWVLYAGVEFGNDEYKKEPDSLIITASCNSTAGGVVEVWLDSLDSNSKIAECTISNTGAWTTYQTFTTSVLMKVTGKHDVYLRFTGSGTDKLFMLQWLAFKEKPATSGLDSRNISMNYYLGQNYPNPFNPVTQINYSVPFGCYLKIKVYNLLGQEVKSLFEGFRQKGNYIITFDGGNLSSGLYFYRMTSGNFVDTKKTMLLK